MSTEDPSQRGTRFILYRNWTSLAGVVVAVASGFSFVLLMIMDYYAHETSPYLGILTYLVSPGFFVFGLFLITVGWLLHRRRAARSLAGAVTTSFTIDLSRPRDRKRLTVFLAGSALFLLVSSIGSYQTYHVTKTVQFCGQTCHTVMEPQYVAYQLSPHAQVECTACHIAPGAKGFVKAKLGGLHQVYATVLGKVERPINAHEKIQINQSTCEQCHWPSRYVGNLDRTFTHFLDDTTNTPYSVRLLLKVGGGDTTHGPAGGIHWHMNLANKVEYIATDPLQQKIPWVRLTDTRGVVTEYRASNFKDDPAKHTVRTMDCMDCHNRPAHQFRSPNDAVDIAMATGRIGTNLPAIKHAAVVALTKPNATREEGLQNISNALRAKYPASATLDSTIASVQQIYRQCFFPEMKTDWKLHPDNIGHKDSPGCFRCHDGEHKTSDGKHSIDSKDCNSCHTILAEGRGADLENLAPKGAKFKHPEEGWDALRCFDCHNGTIEDKEEAKVSAAH